MAASELTREDAVDSLVDADRTVVPGTARAALSHQTFRRFYIGAFVSNIGTWMQSAVLGAYAFKLTGSASFVGLIVFAQLGPLLLFSLVGGTLADIIDRRLLLMAVAVEQLVLSLGLALLTTNDDPSRAALVGLVFAIGVGQAVHAPANSAVLPSLVGPGDLAGAISLNSTQMNASRVIGPAVGGALFAAFGVSWVFVVNAASYLAILAVLAVLRFPAVVPDPNEPRGWRRLMGGFVVARDDTVVLRVLVMMTLFSLLCLPFVTQVAVLGEDNFGIDPQSIGFGVLYGCLGAGAVIGSLSIGTFLSGYSKRRVVRQGLVGYAGLLALLAVLREPIAAYPVMLLVGIAYFATVTSLSTLLQEQLDDRVRGRVMALWIMSFGGMVPIGSLIAGPVIEATSISTVMLFGAACSGILGLYAYVYTSERPRSARAQ